MTTFVVGSVDAELSIELALEKIRQEILYLLENDDRIQSGDELCFKIVIP